MIYKLSYLLLTVNTKLNVCFQVSISDDGSSIHPNLFLCFSPSDDMRPELWENVSSIQAECLDLTNHLVCFLIPSILICQPIITVWSKEKIPAIVHKIFRETTHLLHWTLLSTEEITPEIAAPFNLFINWRQLRRN